MSYRSSASAREIASFVVCGEREDKHRAKGWDERPGGGWGERRGGGWGAVKVR